MKQFHLNLHQRTMMFHHPLTVGALLLLLPFVSMETCSTSGIPGMPGIPGLPGRDGRNGENGEKGERVSVLLQVPQKGERGDSGLKGAGGKRGAEGERGEPGQRGPTGETGAPGEIGAHSAFSVSRASAEFPEASMPIRFLNVITDINQEYNTATGRFRCKTPGTYYFVYHATETAKLCVLLKLDGIKLASFCDTVYNNNPKQVSSGGLAVYLKKDQEVWLETNDASGMTATATGGSVFSGFLLHAHP